MYLRIFSTNGTTENSFRPSDLPEVYPRRRVKMPTLECGGDREQKSGPPFKAQTDESGAVEACPAEKFLNRHLHIKFHEIAKRPFNCLN